MLGNGHTILSGIRLMLLRFCDGQTIQEECVGTRCVVRTFYQPHAELPWQQRAVLLDSNVAPRLDRLNVLCMRRVRPWTEKTKNKQTKTQVPT